MSVIVGRLGRAITRRVGSSSRCRNATVGWLGWLRWLEPDVSQTIGLELSRFCSVGCGRQQQAVAVAAGLSDALTSVPQQVEPVSAVAEKVALSASTV